MTWPISRNLVELALSQHAIPPLHTPRPKVIAQSARHEWVRFEVRFSRLAPERLPMFVDIRTGKYISDKEKIAAQIARSFTEPITDIVVTKEGTSYVAQFTLFVASDRGEKAYQERLKNKGKSWDEFAAMFS